MMQNNTCKIWGNAILLEKISVNLMLFISRFSNQKIFSTILIFLCRVVIHDSFSQHRKEILANTDLTPSSYHCCYVKPCTYQAWHIADTFRHHNCTTNDATPLRLNFLKPWSEQLSNDMLL